jgi:hypothetical protein
MALCGLLAARAIAQVKQPSAAGVDAAYYTSVNQGLAEYEAHNYEEALSLFIKAHALNPNARTLRGMATAEYELRRYVACVQHTQQALDSQVKPLMGKLRTETEDLLRKAQQYVSRVAVELQPAMTRPHVLVDSEAVELPADGVLVLQVGERVVEVQAEGFEPEHRKLTVLGGSEQKLSFTLHPVSAAPMTTAPPAPSAAIASTAQESKAAESTVAAPRDQPVAQRSAWNSPWLWTGVGVVAVGAVVAVVLLSGGQSAAHPEGPVTTPNTPAGVVVMALH